MKTKSIITLAVSFGLMATSYAEENKGKKRPGGHRLPPEIIEKFDTDNDGKVSKEERGAQKEEIKAAMKEHKAAMLEKFDTDKDGELSREERKTMRQARFDKDGDGSLNDEEKAEMKKARKSWGKKGGPKGKKSKKGKKNRAGE